MHKTNSNICIIGVVLFIICLFFSCVMNKASDSVVIDLASDSVVIDLARDAVVMDLARDEFFVNCTNDTLFICPSHYNDVDSIYDRAFPFYSQSSCKDDMEVLFEVNGLYIHNNEAILPDSTCRTDYYLLRKTDTCHFFLIKWSDAKKYSWDEIRDNKMFHTWILTKNKKGEYDTNIRYSD